MIRGITPTAAMTRLEAAHTWATAESASIAMILDAFAPIAAIDLTTSHKAQAVALGAWGDAKLTMFLHHDQLHITIMGDGPMTSMIAELPPNLRATTAAQKVATLTDEEIRGWISTGPSRGIHINSNTLNAICTAALTARAAAPQVPQ